jgi:Zierdtviridae exonuclease
MSIQLLRNSERSSWTKCRQQWYWSWKEQLKPIAEVPALRFGDLVHQALAAYYIPGTGRGPHPANTFERLYQAQVADLTSQGFDVWSDEGWKNAGDLGVSMLDRYVNEYAEADKKFEVIQSEIQFRFPLRLKPNSKPVAIFVGTIDGLWKDRTKTKRPFIFVEHKTATNIVVDGLAMDEQAGSYWTYGPTYMARQGLFEHPEEINGILYNFLRKAKPNPDKTYDAMGRVLNKDGSISKTQPAPYFARELIFRDQVDRERVHARVLEQLDEIAKARAGRMPIYKTPGPWYMPNCRGCSFRDMCELHETGNNWKSMLTLYERWEPYSEHELASGERT